MNTSASADSSPPARRLRAALAWAEREARVVPGVFEAAELRALHAFARGEGPWSPALLAPLSFFAQMLARLPPLEWDAPINLGDALGFVRARLQGQARRSSARNLPPNPRLSPSTFAALGFADTTAGIDREQARHAEGWREHAERAHDFIRAAAGRASPGAALVIGAGRAHDLPLAALADRFASLVLVDVDGQALAQTVRTHVPVGMQDRVETMVLDVSRLAEAFVARAAPAVRAAPGLRAAVSALARLCADCHLPTVMPLLADRSFDLVVSSLVMSQLHVPLAAHARHLLRRRFGADADEDARELDDALFQMAMLLQQDHIDGLLCQGTLVALLSDVWEEPITRDGGGTLVSLSDAPRRQLGATTLAERVPSAVVPFSSASWTWSRLLPDAAGELGTRARIDALLLPGR